MNKLIMRADDLGFSEGVNYGIYKSIQDGVITAVALMANMPYAKHGYELIKDFDIAIGLHCNICADKPLTDPQLIPSLVQSHGEFCSSKDIRERTIDSVDIEECERELQAQLDRFRELVGRDPDYVECHAVFSKNFFIAIENISKKNNLFFENPIIDLEWEKENGIYGFGFAELDENGLYDPKEYMNNHLQQIKENPCSIAVFHPGFLDQYIIEHSSFTFIRPMECEFLCSDWIKQWIKEHDIQLVDFRNYQ